MKRRNLWAATLVSVFLATSLATPANAVPTWTDELHSFQFYTTSVDANYYPNVVDAYDIVYNANGTTSNYKTSASSSNVLATSPQATANSLTISGTRDTTLGGNSYGGSATSATYIANNNAAYVVANNTTGAPYAPDTPGELTKITSTGIEYITTISSSANDIYRALWISANSSGQAFVLGSTDGTDADVWADDFALWNLNLTTGVATNKKPITAVDSGTTVSPNYVQGFSINPLTNKFYLSIDAMDVVDAGIYEINTSTGLLTLVKTNSNPYSEHWSNITFDHSGNLFRIWSGGVQTANFADFTRASSPTSLASISYGSLMPVSDGPIYFIPPAGSGGGGTGGGGNTGGGTGSGGSGSSGSGTTSGTTPNSLAPGEQSALGPNVPSTPPAQGSTNTTVGGNSVRTNTSSNDTNETVTTSNGGTYASSLTFKDLDGDSPVPLTTNETIGAEPGSDLSVTGKGFKSRTQVQVYLIDANGNSTYLGKINTSLFGRVKGKLPVPAGLKSGKYTLQVNGFTSKKQLVKSTNLGMEVVQDDLGSLYFNADSAVATDETKAAVKEMSKSLDAGETVILYGYTSGNPESSYRAANFALAKRRTNTIKSLFDAEGVESTIVIEPRGAVSPYGAGGHAKNRRVDVKPSN